MKAFLLLVFLLLAPGLAAREVSVTILHTTDLHGHVWPTRDYDGNEGVGGLLRSATAIENVRHEARNVLLVDCGDLYQGGIESHMTQGRIMNEALEWLRYDAWVIGNHEFDWGLDVLAARIRESRVPVMTANMGARPGRANPLPQVRPFIIREVDGVRIALVGLTTPAIPTWSRSHLLGDLVFYGSVDHLRRVMPAVRAEKPDVLVLLAHQGYRAFGDNHVNEINAIARHFPEFDFILGGHSHQPVASAVVNGILYSQAGYFGIWLGRLDFVYDTVAREITQRDAQLIHITDTVPMHEGLRVHLQKTLDKARTFADRRVGTIARTLEARHGGTGQSDLQQLICKSIADAIQAPIVLHSAFSNEPLPAGDVYERDIWRLIPYENTIGMLHLTFQELREILEENALLLRSGQFMGVYGVSYDLSPHATPGERVSNLRLADGSAPHPRRRYPVALNSYVLASGGGRFPVVRRLADNPLCRLEMTATETRAAMRQYIERNSPVDVSTHGEVQRLRR